MLAWDIPFIFRAAGGAKGIVDLCANAAPDVEPPAPSTVSVWKHRGRIAADWLPVVVFALLEKSVPANDMLRHYDVPATDLDGDGLDPASVGL